MPTQVSEDLLEPNEPRHIYRVSAGAVSGSSSPTPLTIDSHTETGGLQLEQMLPPPPLATSANLTADAWGFTPPTVQHETGLQEAEKQKIIVALHNMAQSSPPCLFARRYLLTHEFANGGQSVAVFARSAQ
jgi:hypothetical protein